ncbi:MAG: T9SS type A sorting domain-containing protein, partial [candidate division WOR-3 bacterium]|nr:T9SS type A sorting domain-containing protein [candidate division WOR-3 bacterium]
CGLRAFIKELFINQNNILGKCCLKAKDTMYLLNFPDGVGFNLFGDPELNIWTKTPKIMVVQHDTLIPGGNKLCSLKVKTRENIPIESALVCLMKKEDNVYAYGYTNEEGVIVFNINLTSLGWLQVTVTAPNHLPYEDSIRVIYPQILKDATYPNQSHHIVREPNTFDVDFTYHSVDSIIWQIIGERVIYPPFSLKKGRFPTIAKKIRPWICYVNKDTLHYLIKRDNIAPGRWWKREISFGNGFGPPSLILSVISREPDGNLGYVVYIKHDFTTSRNYLCFSAFDSFYVYYSTILDSGNIPTEPNSSVSSPSIAITPGDYIHIVWEKNGRIYYKTTLRAIHPDSLIGGIYPIWSEKVPVSTPLRPTTEPALNPFVEAQGEFIYVVWRGPNEEGNQNFGEIWQRVGRIQPGSLPQWPFPPKNLSKSPYRESNYPTKSTGSVTVYQEELPNNWEVYANIEFLGPETLNISQTNENSFYPHCNFLPLILYPKLFSIWTEEVVPNKIYKIKTKKQSFFISPPVEPAIALNIVIGQPEPSIYCLKRDGYNDLANYPYDYGKELIYKIPYLHPQKYYSISLIFYLENSGQGKSEEKAVVSINNKVIDTISFFTSIPETCNFEIPYGLYESSYVILKIRNIFNSNCGISNIKVYEYEKMDDETGGSQNLSSLSIKDFILYPYPNPAKKNLFIRYQLPKESEVYISLYNILGKEIKRLKEKKKKGIYEIKLNTKEIPSGIYFIHLKTNDLQKAKKVVITK